MPALVIDVRGLWRGIDGQIRQAYWLMGSFTYVDLLSFVALLAGQHQTSTVDLGGVRNCFFLADCLLVCLNLPTREFSIVAVIFMPWAQIAAQRADKRIVACTYLQRCESASLFDLMIQVCGRNVQIDGVFGVGSR